MSAPLLVEFHRTTVNRAFPWEKSFQVLCEKILLDHQASGVVNIILCSDQEVRALNRDYRKLDKVTDVLSFEWQREGIFGEIFIAEQQVQKQAPRYNNSYRAELRRMLIHGCLHLCGYDHMEVSERKTMRAKEEEYSRT